VVRFSHPWISLPGGFFFEIDGDRAEARTLVELRPKAAAILARHGRGGESVDAAVAAFMCPRLGNDARWACSGEFRHEKWISPRDALAKSAEFGGRPVVPFDEVERRLAACSACPKHYRGWCLTCNGHLERVLSLFGGARPRLPADSGSGVCRCTGAYEAAMVSVAYGEGDEVWEGAPETCWRRRDV